MAEVPPTPPPAPQPEHQTLVLTDPPPEKHHTLLWSLCVLAVAVTTGGLVYAYWQTGVPARVPIVQNDELPPGADPNTFVVLNEIYGKDANHVYGIVTDEENTPHMIVGADAASFQVLTGGYAKDLNYVYWSSRVIEGADPITVVSFGEYPYAKDKNKVYWRTWVINPTLDPNTFAPLSSTYVKDAKGVYFVCPGGDCVVKIEEADTETFTVLSEEGVWGWPARDKNYYYLNGEIATTTSQVVGKGVPILDTQGNQTGYEKDSEKIYYSYPVGSKEELNNADLATFEFIGEPLPGQAAGIPYVKDKNQVYIGSRVIEDADPATFEFMAGTKEEWGTSQQFAKDKNHVYDIYLAGLVVQGADPETFTQLNYMYSKDKNNVYSRDWSLSDSEYRVIKGADPATFTFIKGQESYDAEDKNQKYLRGEIVE